MLRSCEACQSLWFSPDLPKETMQRRALCSSPAVKSEAR